MMNLFFPLLKSIPTIILCQFILLNIPSPSLCKNWYVIPDNDKSKAIHNGSKQYPWNGFDDIVWGKNGVSPGDALILKSNQGIFKKCLNIHGSGSPGKAIIIRGEKAHSIPVIENTQDISSEFIPWEKDSSIYITRNSGWPNRFYFYENGRPLLWGAEPENLQPGTWHLKNFGRYYYRPTSGTIEQNTISVPFQVSRNSFNDDDEFCIDINDQKFIVIQGIEMRCSSRAGIMIRGGASNIIIKNNVFRYHAVQAINMGVDHPFPNYAASRDIDIVDNFFEKNANGIYIRDGEGNGPEIKASNIFIHNNTFMNNDFRYSYQYASDTHAIGTQSMDDSVISNNRFENCVANHAASTAGIYLWARKNFTSNGNTVSDNTFRNITGTCLGQGAIPTGTQFLGNVCENASIGIIARGGCSIEGNKFLKIRKIGIYLKSPSSGINIRQNMISMADGSAYSIHAAKLDKCTTFYENQFINPENKFNFHINGKDLQEIYWEQ